MDEPVFPLPDETPPSETPSETPPDEAPTAALIVEPPTAREPIWQRGAWRLGAGVLAAFLLFVAGLVAGGEWSSMAWSAVEVAPFAVLALLAYLGAERWWAQPLAAAYMLLLVAGIGLLIVVFTAFALHEDEAPRSFAQNALAVGVVATSVGIGLVMAGLSFAPPVRRLAAGVLPLDPKSFVHAVALATVAPLTLMTFAPLLVLSAPPLLAVVESMLEQGIDLTEGRGPEGMLRDEVYGLAWLVPATVVAVGYGLRRNFRDSLERLGLVRPTWRQVVSGVGLAFALVIAVNVLSIGLDEVWKVMGWPTTDADAFEGLMAHFISPAGAIVLGIVAGLGEELAVRGCLQPRLGILLSNLFFTSLHALQYHWDALLVVFLIGMVLGIIRQRTNTTTSAIVHGTYDFLLVVVVLLEIPWLSE